MVFMENFTDFKLILNLKLNKCLLLPNDVFSSKYKKKTTFNLSVKATFRGAIHSANLNRIASEVLVPLS